MQVLDEHGKPMSLNQLITHLDIKKTTEQEAINYRLKAMVRDGQIIQDRRNRFCLVKRILLKRGTVQAHPEGFGFFIPDDGTSDMLLSAKAMQTVMHGDIVLAYQTGVDKRGRLEGKIHEILEHVNHTVVGRFFIEQGVGFVLPDNKRLTQDILVPMECANSARHGQMVMVEIIAFPTKYNQAIGKVVYIIGDHMAPGLEIDVAMLAYSIPAQWSQDVLDEVARIPQKVIPEQLNGRTDLRHLPFVTIDGEDAKDFDDAVYCCQTPTGAYRLYVAIADVSYYVKQDSALDKEASVRGNSIYFPGRVIPMLPEALSNGICSLNPNVDRLCIVAEMYISSQGKITRSKFYRAVFCSTARLTYTEVAKWMNMQCNANQSTMKNNNKFAKCAANLMALTEVFNVLLQARQERGAISFETTETRIEFDAKRKIKRIIPVIRNDAYRLIEECMLAANMATARFLTRAKIPALYRVHAAPDADKIQALRLFLGELGLRLGGSKKPQPKDFQKTMYDIGNRPERHVIEAIMLRSLKQAQYVQKNTGHFGLAYSMYTHFTSPIRRYPDLLIHRALCHLIDNKQIVDFTYTTDDMSKLGQHCSDTERRADEATRQVIAWLKCEYMQGKLGQVYPGTISAVTGFGIFVELNNIYVEGLVHITSLRNDYYTFDAIKHRLTGTRTGQMYRLGDEVSVLVARVDLDERKIDFELAVCN